MMTIIILVTTMEIVDYNADYVVVDYDGGGGDNVIIKMVLIMIIMVMLVIMMVVDCQ